MNYKIILGSGSPRRKQLLEGLGFDIEVRVKNLPEDFHADLKREEIALHLAQYKAEAFLGELKNDELLITADTIVWIDDHVLNKPIDKSDAIRMLHELSGKGHQVYTGVCLSTNKKTEIFYVESTVWFNKLNDEQINYYIDTYQPFDKAGSYGAQECLPEGMNPCSPEEKKFLESIHKPKLFEESIAFNNKKHFAMIDRIEGSYFNVMGLPVVELYQRLKARLRFEV